MAAVEERQEVCAPYLQSAPWPVCTRTTASPSSRVRRVRSCSGQMLRSLRLREDVTGVERLRWRRRRNPVSSRGGSCRMCSPSARRPVASEGRTAARTRAPCLRPDSSSSCRSSWPPQRSHAVHGIPCKYRKALAFDVTSAFATDPAKPANQRPMRYEVHSLPTKAVIKCQ